MSLGDFLTNGYLEQFGMTKEGAQSDGVCVACKKPPVFYSEAGRREYRISALCEPCFDKMFPPDEDEP